MRHECDSPFSCYVAQMRRSTVVGAGGKSVLDTIRTSRGTFLRCAAALSKRVHMRRGLRQDAHAVLLDTLTMQGAAWACHHEQHPHPTRRWLPAAAHGSVGHSFVRGPAEADRAFAFRRRYRDPVVTRVERRLELYTHINISHQEDVQILRYSDGEKCALPCCCCSDARLLQRSIGSLKCYRSTDALVPTKPRPVTN